jgi:hypothetical protein
MTDRRHHFHWHLPHLHHWRHDDEPATTVTGAEVGLLISEVQELRALLAATAQAVQRQGPKASPTRPTDIGRKPTTRSEELLVWSDVLGLLCTSSGVILGHRVNQRSFSLVRLNAVEASRLRAFIADTAAALTKDLPEQAEQLSAWERSLADRQAHLYRNP